MHHPNLNNWPVSLFIVPSFFQKYCIPKTVFFKDNCIWLSDSVEYLFCIVGLPSYFGEQLPVQTMRRRPSQPLNCPTMALHSWWTVSISALFLSSLLVLTEGTSRLPHINMKKNNDQISVIISWSFGYTCTKWLLVLGAVRCASRKTYGVGLEYVKGKGRLSFLFCHMRSHQKRGISLSYFLSVSRRGIS